MLQARRRLRKGVQMIIAINKFSNMFESLKKEAGITPQQGSNYTTATLGLDDAKMQQKTRQQQR